MTSSAIYNYRRLIAGVCGSREASICYWQDDLARIIDDAVKKEFSDPSVKINSKYSIVVENRLRGADYGEIAEILNLTAERVRHLEARARSRLIERFYAVQNFIQTNHLCDVQLYDEVLHKEVFDYVKGYIAPHYTYKIKCLLCDSPVANQLIICPAKQPKLNLSDEIISQLDQDNIYSFKHGLFADFQSRWF